jgi:hypothetical protein
MDLMAAVKNFIEVQPDYNGNGRFVIHASSDDGWSLSYHVRGHIKPIEYSFKINDQGVPVDYRRL